MFPKMSNLLVSRTASELPPVLLNLIALGVFCCAKSVHVFCFSKIFKEKLWFASRHASLFIQHRPASVYVNYEEGNLLLTFKGRIEAEPVGERVLNVSMFDVKILILLNCLLMR